MPVTTKKKAVKKKAAVKTAVKKKFTSVNEYISELPTNSKSIAKELRSLIQQTAPKAEEVISYNIPLYKQNGMLISFAVWKDHIGMYPLTDTMETAIKELLPYKGAKHSLKFPLSEPLPMKLIAKAVKFRIKENEGKV